MENGKDEETLTATAVTNGAKGAEIAEALRLRI